MAEEADIEKIQLLINNFIANNNEKIGKKSWISDKLLYTNSNAGGFNMIKISHFFQALKTSWVKRYINGINDHWADLVDTELNLEPATRIKLAHLGTDNPKIKQIINRKYQGISMFFQAFSNINHAFHKHKERNDNRWKHGPLFYNTSLTREEWKGKTSKKPNKTNVLTITPNEFGLPESISSEIKIYQLFENNKIITQGQFETKFKYHVNYLNYASLCKILKKI